MPDTITSEERALIDAAVQGKRVTKVVQGTYTKITPAMRGRPARYETILPGQAEGTGQVKEVKSRGRVADTRFDSDVRRGVAAGWDRNRIAASTGLSYSQVTKIIKRLGLRPVPAKRSAPSSAQSKPRRKRSAEIYAGIDTAKFTIRELSEMIGKSIGAVRNDQTRLGFPYKKGQHGGKRTQGGKHDAEIERFAREGLTNVEIGRRLEMFPRSVSVAIKRLGLREVRKAAQQAQKPPIQPKPAAKTTSTATEKRKARADKKVATVRDRRRFKQTPVPTGNIRARLEQMHPAAVDAETIHVHKRVAEGQDRPVLIDAASNSKIGGDVLVGWLKGAKVFTVTLEERRTCPRSCAHWLSCYGNGDPWAWRWQPGEAFEWRLQADLVEACTKHDRVLVRLHYLGDFYSEEYVALWSSLLDEFDNLYVFGFTAHAPDTPIGGLIGVMRDQVHRERFFVRHSGQGGAWGSDTIDFPTEKKVFAGGIVCPEQISAMAGSDDNRHCGSCGVCWSTDKAIWFVEH